MGATPAGHRGPDVQAVLADHPRLRLEQLQADAPVLNPVEHLWSHLKWSKLCNFDLNDADDMDSKIALALEETTLDQKLLLGF